ncbi:FAD-dependent monooxygenase [Nocardiopsis metallicus]|uniref:2-polyprenyl-6-methoxyphenol hydroxylase-like FAD-dependent oxidoreductase n=1 Tax=Nocardiopsis metallicus TaxID=179819 RepID=A0A840W7J5_9ACTN|nr:FAD-dependent monooxygenase [Nocardiopsis metallicus]MBB5492004.1 2-polyprenyl-6-methoxyphenol hydroxylase-like FAD-dependent oxidoreductase [Nocardiopsis metallicus]
MPISNRNVLVSGGGVAASALAVWLARGGFAPTVVDPARGARSKGAHVEVSGPGMALLDRMGAGEAVRALGAPVAEVHTHVSGRREPVRVPGEPGCLTVRHDHLVGALREEAEQADTGQVKYLPRDTVTALEQDEEGVDVAFANSPGRRFDLVVGADGPHSPVRALAFAGPDANHLRYLGANTAVFETRNILGTDSAMAWHMWPHRGCVVTTLPGADRAEAVFLMRDRFPVREGSLDRSARQRLVEEFFGQDGWKVPELLRAMGEGDLKIAPATQVRMDVWAHNRVVLVGDAAYAPGPLSGQGPAMALMGALALAGELVAAEGDHDRAFFSYEAAVRPSVREAQAVAPYVIDSVAPETGRYETWIRERAEVALARGTQMMGRLGLRPPLDTTGREFAVERYASVLDA